MLELHDVLIQQRQQPVSLTARDGQLVCISGAPGSGKTTLLRTVMGLVPFRGGHISFDGELLTPLSAVYFRHFMGYVPSRLELIPGQDRVADARRLLQGLSAGRQQLLPSLPGEERLWGQLSRQEQFLVLLQLVVSQQRRLLLVDEPHCALSQGQQYEAEVLLPQALSAGASVVVVSSEQSVRSLTPNIIEL